MGIQGSGWMEGGGGGEGGGYTELGEMGAGSVLLNSTSDTNNDISSVEALSSIQTINSGQLGGSSDGKGTNTSSTSQILPDIQDQNSQQCDQQKYFTVL